MKNKKADYSYITLRDDPALKEVAAQWFHNKWGVPEELIKQAKEFLPDDILEVENRVRIALEKGDQPR